MDVNNLYDIILDHAKTFFYPEEWLELDLNFSKTELMALLLVERKRELSMSQLAEAINMPMSTATGIADRMVRSGLLKRERSELDRRVVVVRLTDEGNQLIVQMKELVTNYISKIEAELTDEEKQLLIKVFFKVVNIFKNKQHKADKQETTAKIQKIEID
ncbi:MarR family winged helix-turn-helix transcriptional regulator [Desulfuribacillus alkaliarsenatis]|uniref:TrmB family transcriptional regulator n=1 Tax=Desulfuribacillus alkaliarsenatis TaxID=766136 RepID=A0A1E5G305_9FIRM|nr:MarR family transcriptional regulator [Desulfuribacillus alkaliarsenatis]OEF97457.1 TrmB family transcriptional regulator [Desulfuribacillus alkaliarsenatis]